MCASSMARVNWPPGDQLAKFPSVRAHQLMSEPPCQVLPQRALRHHHLDESLRLQPDQQQRDGRHLRPGPGTKALPQHLRRGPAADPHHDEVRLPAEKVQHPKEEEPLASDQTDANGYDKLTTSKLAKALGLRTGDLNDKLLAAGLIEKDGDGFKLTGKGKDAGGEFRYSKKFGPFFLWPPDLPL